MDRVLLAAATIQLLAAIGYTIYIIGAGKDLPVRFNFWMLLGAFAMQSAFLWLRGQELGRCPLTNFYEVFIFLSWAVVFFYLIVGTSLRVSLMGAFTGPLALLLLILALLAGDTPSRLPLPPPNPLVELHASTSVIAYGAFGLACVTGIMYFLQDNMLKTRRILPIFYKLPSVTQLTKVIDRLLWLGTLLLGVGILAGFALGYLPHKGKMLVAILVLGLYLLMLLARLFNGLNAKRLALAAIYGFLLSMGAFCWITFTSLS